MIHMRYDYTFPLIFILFIFLYGCYPHVDEIGNPKLANEYAKTYLPYNAKNLRQLGNSWILFDLEINGKTRTYMYQESEPIGQNTSGAIVEVKD